MARQVSDRDGAQHRRALAGLGRLLRRDLTRVRRLLVPAQPASFTAWAEAVGLVVARYGQMAAALSAEVYEAQRADAGVQSPFQVRLADPPPAEQVEATLRWAAKDVWPRNPEQSQTTVAQARPQTARTAVAERKTIGAVEKLVLDVGRETTRQAIREDRDAIGYARAAALGACSFCKLMASRGAIYGDLDAVGRAANEDFTGADSVIKFHDWCRCQPIAIYVGDRFELSPQAARWDQLYQQHAAPYPGDQLRRFRQAIAEHEPSPIT